MCRIGSCILVVIPFILLFVEIQATPVEWMNVEKSRSGAQLKMSHQEDTFDDEEEDEEDIDEIDDTDDNRIDVDDNDSNADDYNTDDDDWNNDDYNEIHYEINVLDTGNNDEETEDYSSHGWQWLNGKPCGYLNENARLWNAFKDPNKWMSLFQRFADRFNSRDYFENEFDDRGREFDFY